VTESGSSSVWVHEGAPNRTTRLPSSGDRSLPVWTPDGRFFVLNGERGLSWIRSDNGGRIESLLRADNMQVPWSFTPDGKRLAYHEMNSTSGFDLWTVPIEVSANGLNAGTPEPYLRTPAYETYPAFSPDGQWIAYGSNESGSWEVYVRHFPDNGTKVQVSEGGGRVSRWSSNNRELFYRTDNQEIMVATYAAKGSEFSVRSRRRWTETRLADSGVLANFDLSPEGDRILALVPAMTADEQQAQNHVTFMLNFADDLRRRVSSRAITRSNTRQ